VRYYGKFYLKCQLFLGMIAEGGGLLLYNLLSDHIRYAKNYSR